MLAVTIDSVKSVLKYAELGPLLHETKHGVFYDPPKWYPPPQTLMFG